MSQPPAYKWVDGTSLHPEAVGGDQQLVCGTECSVVWMKLEVRFDRAQRRPQHVPTLGVIDEQGDIACPIDARRRTAQGEVKQQIHTRTFVVLHVSAVTGLVRK